MNVRKTSVVAALTSSALLLGACAADGADTAEESTAADGATTTAETTTATTAATEDATAAGEVITLEEGFVREKAADSMMTGVFGTLTNHTDEELELVGFDTDLGAGMNELHEVVDGVMQEKTDPMLIPANGTYELEPGGDHLMIMGVEEEILAGDVVTVTLEFADGSTADLPEVPVRTVLAGEENYGADGDLQGHSSHMDGEMSE